MPEIITVKPELSPEDCFRIVERHKRTFSYPVHRHDAMELNFIQNCSGVRRIVRDSMEVVGDYDLVLIAENLEHTWEQGDCVSPDVREVTIHFPSDLFNGNFRGKHQFSSMMEMLHNAKRGLVFDMSAILDVYSLIDRIPKESNSFEQFILFERILFILSKSPYRMLTSDSSEITTHVPAKDPVEFVSDYLRMNYNKDIYLSELAAKLGMSSATLSRLFKQKTGMTVSSYLIELKLKAAARSLVDTSDKIADICRACGFNNLSNFNRTFKARRGKTPKDYRNLYKKNKITV